jgi:phospholipid/cholesterol/gamma-HCH transport system substrate-binding protein
MEVKVGMLVTVCVGLLAGFIVMLGDCSTAGRGDLFLDVDTTSDLKVGSPVKIAGVPAGKVDAIVYRGGEIDEATKRRVWVRVKLRVDSEKIPTIHDDSRFYITTQGVLGEKYVEIDPGSPEKPSLAPGAVRRGEPPLRLEIIAAQAGRLLESVTKLVGDNEGSLAAILNDTRDTVASLKSAAAKADTLISANEEKLTKIIDELLAAEADARTLLASANHAIGDGDELRRTIAKRPGDIWRNPRLRWARWSAGCESTLDAVLEARGDRPGGGGRRAQRAWSRGSTTRARRWRM